MIKKRKQVKRDIHIVSYKEPESKETCGVVGSVFCLAYKDQSRQLTTDADKEELYQAGLGEKEIEFECLDLGQLESESF